MFRYPSPPGIEALNLLKTKFYVLLALRRVVIRTAELVISSTTLVIHNLPLVYGNVEALLLYRCAWWWRAAPAYSHKDRALADDLDEHFGILRRVGLIEHWFSHQIGPGEEWQGQIEERLESADIILLLVSPSFINSHYCWDVEVSRAMERHRAKEARVIPVILRPCLWRVAPFGELQGLPEGGEPITSWANQDEAFTSVVQAVYDVAKTLRPIQST